MVDVEEWSWHNGGATEERDDVQSPEAAFWTTSGGRAAFDWLKPRLDGVLLGPTGAGKTALVAALQRACEAATPALGLELVPGLTLANLTGTGPSAAPVTYDFQLRFRGGAFPESPESPTNFSVLLRDLPGRSFFDSSIDWDHPDGATAEGLAETASAAWWILLVDSFAPRPELWQFRLPQLIAHSVYRDPSATVRVAGASLRHQSQTPSLALKRRLVQQRVLVLLNKVDLLAEHALAELRSLPRSTLDPRLRALETLDGPSLAARLDPVRTAQDLLGGGLGQLRAALAEEAQLAVGWLCATGFPPTRPDEAIGTGRFGVREAMTFLATGRCLPPIHPVTSLVDLNPAPWSRRS
jgi:hypothetical protein